MYTLYWFKEFIGSGRKTLGHYDRESNFGKFYPEIIDVLEICLRMKTLACHWAINSDLKECEFCFLKFYLEEQ